MTLDIRRLRYFRMIATQGSLSAAARALNVAQPALTHHVSELERALGVMLFDRTPRGVELTSAGRLLLKHAHNILDNVATAENQLRMLSPSAPQRSLHFSVTPSLAVITPALLAETSRLLPDVTVRVSSLDDRHSSDMIAQGHFDMGVMLADWTQPGGIPLVWDSFVWAGKPSGEPETGPMPFSEIDGIPLILPFPGNPLRRLVDDTAHHLGVTLNIVSEIEGTESRKEAMLGGIGSSFLPWRTVARECETGLLSARPVTDPPLKRLFVLQHKQGLDPATIKLFRETIRALLKGPTTELA